MRPLPLLSILLLLLAGPRPATAAEGGVSGADRAQIRSVIERQLAAFARDDGAAAFRFASPAIREYFGSADRFMHMVESDYGALRRPRSVHFDGARRSGGEVVQAVDVIGPDGTGARALYFMEREKDGRWRINGVRLAPNGQRES